MFLSRFNQAKLVVALALIKRDLLSSSSPALGTRHSRSSSCLKTCIINWLCGSATTQGWYPSIHTTSQGLYMRTVHTLDKIHCLTHRTWFSPDTLRSKLYESPKQWKPLRGVWVYFRISENETDVIRWKAIKHWDLIYASNVQINYITNHLYAFKSIY